MHKETQWSRQKMLRLQQIRIKNSTPTGGAVSMSASQLEHYMSLLIEKYEILGEHYVARQLAWAERQLVAMGVSV